MSYRGRGKQVIDDVDGDGGDGDGSDGDGEDCVGDSDVVKMVMSDGGR